MQVTAAGSSVGSSASSAQDSLTALMRQRDQLEQKIRDASTDQTADAKTKEQELAAYQAQLAVVEAQIAQLQAKQAQAAAAKASAGQGSSSGGGEGGSGGAAKASTVHVVA